MRGATGMRTVTTWKGRECASLRYVTVRIRTTALLQQVVSCEKKRTACRGLRQYAACPQRKGRTASDG
eukprot:1243593-Pleurochrysis_carterae.AAC.1